MILWSNISKNKAHYFFLPETVRICDLYINSDINIYKKVLSNKNMGEILIDCINILVSMTSSITDSVQSSVLYFLNSEGT